MKCQICEEQESKYKCPKCSVKYCSLVCFKSEKHIHEEKSEPLVEKPKPAEPATPSQLPTCQSLLEDPVISELISYNTTKFYLNKVYQIQRDTRLTNEQREEMAIDLLNLYRYGGDRYNAAIEEFCNAVVSK